MAINRTIKYRELYKIRNEKTGEIHDGFDQEWYKGHWQRLAGCGPTVFSTIYYYLNRTLEEIREENEPISKERCIELMEEVWNHVKPSFHGVSSTEMFLKGVASYKKFKNQELIHHSLDIAKNPSERPPFKALLAFLDEALEKDTPVAFLNLHNGDEKVLDAWHWVTLIALEYDEEGSFAFAEILDEGKIKKIDLLQWYNTTTLGGGFVSFEPLAPKN